MQSTNRKVKGACPTWHRRDSSQAAHHGHAQPLVKPINSRVKSERWGYPAHHFYCAEGRDKKIKRDRSQSQIGSSLHPLSPPALPTPSLSTNRRRRHVHSSWARPTPTPPSIGKAPPRLTLSICRPSRCCTPPGTPAQLTLTSHRKEMRSWGRLHRS